MNTEESRAEKNLSSYDKLLSITEEITLYNTINYKGEFFESKIDYYGEFYLVITLTLTFRNGEYKKCDRRGTKSCIFKMTNLLILSTLILKEFKHS